MIDQSHGREIQESYFQLVEGFTKKSLTAKSLIEKVVAKAVQNLAINKTQPQLDPITSDTVRIQIGRRVVYGQMANGRFRNEINPERLQVIFKALQQPVVSDVDTSIYRGKLPAIEISDGNNVLFRQEKDGTITANQIQFQLQQIDSAASLEEGTTQKQLENNQRSPLTNTGTRANEQQPKPGTSAWADLAFGDLRDPLQLSSEERTADNVLATEVPVEEQSILDLGNGQQGSLNINQQVTEETQPSLVAQLQGAKLSTQELQLAENLKNVALSAIFNQSEKIGWVDVGTRGVSINKELGASSKVEISAYLVARTGELEVVAFDDSYSLNYQHPKTGKDLQDCDCEVLLLRTDNQGRVTKFMSTVNDDLYSVWGTNKTQLAEFVTEQMKGIEQGKEVIPIQENELKTQIDASQLEKQPPSPIHQTSEDTLRDIGGNDLTPQTEVVEVKVSSTGSVQDLVDIPAPLTKLVHENTLIAEGIDPKLARQVAPLLDKSERSVEEQALITQVSQQYWQSRGQTLQALESQLVSLETTIHSDEAVLTQPEELTEVSLITDSSLQEQQQAQELVPEQTPQQLDSKVENFSVAAPITTDNTDQLTSEQTKDIASVAEYLLNPLGQDGPQYQEVALWDYRIAQHEGNLTVTKGDELIVSLRGGEVIESNGASLQDWRTFQSVNPRSLQQVITQPEVKLEVDEAKRDISLVTPPIQEEVPTLGAVSVAQNQANILPSQSTKKLLQSTTQNWKQQALQVAKEGVKQGVGWLVSRPEIMRQQGLARSAVDLFNRGHERTGEKAYSIGDYKISLQGRNVYTLSDSKGELIKFLASSSLLRDQPAIEIRSTSNRLTKAHYDVFRDLQKELNLVPQGELDVEATYGAKTQRTEQTVKDFLQEVVQAKSWDQEGGKFKLELGEGDNLRIISKQDGRGEVYRRENGQVFSKLVAKDFTHFERLAEKMQPDLVAHRIQQDQNISTTVSAIANVKGTKQPDGSQIYNGQKYQIRLCKGSVSITANDGRGEVFKNGKFTSNASDKDVAEFRNLSKNFKQNLQEQRTQSQSRVRSR